MNKTGSVLRKGGGEIVRRLADRAKEKGASKIFLETPDSGRAPREALGFQGMKDHMKLACGRGM